RHSSTGVPSSSAISTRQSNSVFLDNDLINDVSGRQKKQHRKKGSTSNKVKEISSNGTSASSSPAVLPSTADALNNIRHSELPMHHQNGNDKHLVHNGTSTTESPQMSAPPSITSIDVSNIMKENRTENKTRNDIKLTNILEKNGVWTANAQFGRTSRLSKQVGVVYDQKKFQFITNGNKEVIVLTAEEVEGKIIIILALPSHHFPINSR
ncbi:unnamed protein product, partial [Didymodactylos carnosus]